MRKIFIVFICLCLIPVQSCDDGDIITIELDFEDTFNSCGETNLVLYKTKNDPSESLSLFLSGVTLDEILNVDENGIFEDSYTISTSSPFNYRTYSNTTLPSDLFCSDIPNSEVQITQDYESTSGSADITTILTEDDNDDVPAELDIDIDNDNDTDGDGLLNFIDADDDGDNILTKNENPDPNGDGNLSDAQDTDADGIPDYLDDGDIITIELDFEDTFNSCGETNLVLYKTKNDPSESLSLFLSGVTLDEILNVDENGIFEDSYTISTSSPFNYRTYSNTTLPSDLFCSDIPNSEVQITQDYESTSGSADITTILTEDDNDDVPAELDIDIDNDNDTDGDGLLNFIDADDDGDNILTKNENPDPNGDGNLSDAQDTDADGIPDYLDDDDDGDGDNILTKNENPDPNGDGNLSDAQDTDADGIPDYLDDDNVKFYDANYQKYGLGATEVYIYQNVPSN